jgi:hypothetical protein
VSHLLVYEFERDADFSGHLVGALERMQATGQTQLRDGLFVAQEAEEDEWVAIDLRSGSSADAVARLLTFRLDPEARRRATDKLLSQSSIPREVLEGLGRALNSGQAMLALLVEGPEGEELKDAVNRTGGRTLSSEPVDSTTLAELAPRLLDVLSSR